MQDLQALVDKALADGKLTQAEIDEIMAAVMQDDIVSMDEMQILEMIENKILNQEIELG